MSNSPMTSYFNSFIRTVPTRKKFDSSFLSCNDSIMLSQNYCNSDAGRLTYNLYIMLMFLLIKFFPTQFIVNIGIVNIIELIFSFT